jgi:ABC-type glycerol-3-phosphate transport system substrate-binding protein
MLKKKTSFKIIGLLLIGVFLISSGFGCKSENPENSKYMQPITINYWRVFDDDDAFKEIIAQYRLMHPNVRVNYRKFRFEEFENELLNALAEDRGPDIFSIPQSWLLRYQSKIAPLPESITKGYLIEKSYLGGFKKEQTVEVRTERTPPLREIRSIYTDGIYDDIVVGNQVWGIPLYLDSLIMFYNRDIVNQAGIAQIPDNWNDFQEAVVKTTKFETETSIVQSGAALGTGSNVERAFDIMSILMMQSGAKMIDTRGLPSFFASVGTRDNIPGLTALQFYTDFAQPMKNVYSWNKEMPGSLNAFESGKLAFFFGYNYHIPQIRSRSRVNFGVAPLPQIPGNPVVNYANYYLETVSNKSANQDMAWDFLLFVNKQENIKKYLEKTGRPTAQRALIAEQLEDDWLYPSASQVLTARTWYKGKNIEAAEAIFKEMAEQFLTIIDPRDINRLMSNITQRISQTVN